LNLELVYPTHPTRSLQRRARIAGNFCSRGIGNLA
jgi:hypothetical protein